MAYFRLSRKQPFHFVAGCGSVSLCGVHVPPGGRAQFVKTIRPNERGCSNCQELLRRILSHPGRSIHRTETLRREASRNCPTCGKLLFRFLVRFNRNGRLVEDWRDERHNSKDCGRMRAARRAAPATELGSNDD